MEPRCGHDFSRVRVHSDSAAEQSARQLNAEAYTVGNNIVFGAGRFAPKTPQEQYLIAHELTHVMQQSGSGLVVQRQPDPKQNPPGKKVPDTSSLKPRDPVAEVRKIVSSRSPRANLSSWLRAHPADLLVVEKFLLEQAKTSTAEKEWDVLGDLLAEVFARDPNSGSARATLMDQAKKKTEAVWDQYTTAATIAAVHQWAGDTRERGRIVSKLTSGADKADKAKQLDSLQRESEQLLKSLQNERASLVKDMQHFLSVLPLRGNATFVPTQEQDLVTTMLHQMERGIARAEGIRRQSYEIYSVQTPTSDVDREIKILSAQRDAAETSLSVAQKELDDARKLTGTDSARVRAATAKVKQAEDRKKAVAATTSKASAAAARTMKYQEDVQEKQRVDSALRQQAGARNAFLKSRAANLTLFDTLADGDASWWIYWQFIKNARDGFEGFAMEHTLLPLVLARNKMITRPKATGIDDVQVSLDTYARHGWGQYDLNALARTKIDVVQPPEIDLSQVLGGPPRMFEWVGSRVSAVFGKDPRQTEKDVLDKLAYGFFGLDPGFEKKIEQTDLDAGGLPANRNSAPNRLVAGLLYRHTVEGAELEIENRLIQLRSDLEQKLEDSPEFARLRIDENQEILRETLDASIGDFGTPNMLNRAAFVAVGTQGNIPAPVLNMFNQTISRILKEDNDFTRAVFSLLKERVAYLRSANGVEAGHRGVLDWAGASVYVLHHYRLKGGTEEAWIRVMYLHLHKVDSVVTNESRDPLTVGEVGSSGASINPHVHMSIAVLRTKDTPAIDYIDPTDFFGMVSRSPFKTAP